MLKKFVLSLFSSNIIYAINVVGIKGLEGGEGEDQKDKHQNEFQLVFCNKYFEVQKKKIE